MGDRLSFLPDSVIYHILSFLPSSKEIFRTCVLSKAWRTHYTHVPVLILHPDGMSAEKYSEFVEKMFESHDSSRIDKVLLGFNISELDDEDRFPERIHQAIRKHVRDLNLFSCVEELSIPTCLYKHAELEKFTATDCIFNPDSVVHWGSLTTLLTRYGKFNNESLERILSGSSSLESLELRGALGFDRVNIRLNFLKKLELALPSNPSALELSCPLLKEISLSNFPMDQEVAFQWLQRDVLTLPLLECLEIYSTDWHMQMVVVEKLPISSNSLKRLLLCLNCDISHIEISCPLIEQLVILGNLSSRSASLGELGSLRCATLDFDHFGSGWELGNEADDICNGLIREVLGQLNCVSELRIGYDIMKILTVFEPYTLKLGAKTLSLDCPDVICYPTGIARLLEYSEKLEDLVITYNLSGRVTGLNDSDVDHAAVFWKTYILNPNGLRYLKTIKIFNFPTTVRERKDMVCLIRFILGSANALATMVVTVKDVELQSGIYKELDGLPKCSNSVQLSVEQGSRSYHQE